MGSILFITITFILIALPLLPALSEWLAPVDVKPLKIVQDFDSDTSHFANGFMQYLKLNIPDFFISDTQTVDLGKAAGTTKKGTFKDGTNYIISDSASDNTGNFPDFQILHNKKANKILLSRGNLHLADGFYFDKEIYSLYSIHSGKDCIIRAALTEGDIILEENNTILRWIHGGGSIFAKENCSLLGRASANNAITLPFHCHFERMRAPVIQFGVNNNMPSPTSPISDTERQKLKILKNMKEQDGKRWLLDGDFFVPARSEFDGDIIATGNIEIGRECLIKGSIKSNSNLIIRENVDIYGSVVGAQDVEIGPCSKISNPVISEGTLLIGSNVEIGSIENQSSVIAPVIKCANGAKIHGTIWAYGNGEFIGNKSMT